MNLSTQARDRLSQMLDERVFMFKGGHTKEDVLAEIAAILAASASFSEQIVTNSEVKRRCNLGHLHCVYRLTFRVVLIQALRVLHEAGVPMTTPELLNACPDPNVGRMVGKYFAELRHWGLIEPHADGWYVATARASAFLTGRVPLPVWVWPEGEKLPPECQDGPLRFIDELEDLHPKEDKARHVEEAVSVEKC